MTKQEYYLYCFECECNGEIPLSYEELALFYRYYVALCNTGLAQLAEVKIKQGC